jgi:hypothetical protein
MRRWQPVAAPEVALQPAGEWELQELEIELGHSAIERTVAIESEWNDEAECEME